MLNQMIAEESRNGAELRGDGGRSRGILHIQAKFWSDVTAWRAARKLPTKPYAWVSDPAWSREYGRSGLTMLEEKLSQERRLPSRSSSRSISGDLEVAAPSAGEIYAAWNLGFAKFKARGFDLRRCPRRTRAAAAAVELAVWDADLSQRFRELSAAGARLAATRPGGVR